LAAVPPELLLLRLLLLLLLLLRPPPLPLSLWLGCVLLPLGVRPLF